MLSIGEEGVFAKQIFGRQGSGLGGGGIAPCPNVKPRLRECHQIHNDYSKRARDSVAPDSLCVAVWLG